MTSMEWRILLFLFLWNISGSFTFSGILSQFEESDGEEILVNIQASSRSKRSTNGELHPDHFDLRFSTSGLQIHLALHRNDRLTTDVPTFALKDGKMEYERPNVSQTAVFYQDTRNGGSFLVNFNGDKTETVYGVFQSNGSEFILQSNETKENASQRNGFRKFTINKVRTININNDEDVKSYSWKGQKGKEMTRVKKMNTGRQKRASGSYSVELLIVVDYAVYQRWFLKSNGTTSTQKAENAIASIRQFYAFVINGMDAMYKNIQTSSFTINILFAGIVIAQTPSDATWTESIRIQSVVPNQISAATALNNFNSWINTQTNLPGFDHAMLFTGYEMIRDGSTGIAGYAFTKALCTDYSQSIVEDKFNFVMITVASHELGHSLSADHDGTGNTCLGNNSYIMTSVMKPQSNALTAANPWKFSSCSTNSFNSYIDSLTTGNQNCMTTLSPSYNPNRLASERQRLPGQIYDADQQCAYMVGVGSYMCRQQYSGDYSTICSILWCSDLPVANSNICTSYKAGDGTLCDDRKWCISGVCTSSPNAPSGSGTCLYGDRKGVVFGNGWTCQDMIANGPNNCVNVPIKCCSSCGPTTQAPTTTTTTTTPAPVTTPGPVTTPAPVTPAPVTSTPVPVTPTPNPTGSTPTQTTIVAHLEKDYIYGIIGVAAGGTVLLVIIVVVMLCYCQRREPTTKTKKSTEQRTTINKHQLSYVTHSRPPTGYVNRAMVYDNGMRQPVQKGHSYLQHV